MNLRKRSLRQGSYGFIKKRESLTIFIIIFAEIFAYMETK